MSFQRQFAGGFTSIQNLLRLVQNWRTEIAEELVFVRCCLGIELKLKKRREQGWRNALYILIGACC
jgi:hypothetical protein